MNLTHTLPQPLTLSLSFTHSRTPSPTHTLPHPLSLTHSHFPSPTRALPHPFTLSLTHSPSPSPLTLFLSLTHSHSSSLAHSHAIARSPIRLRKNDPRDDPPKPAFYIPKIEYAPAFFITSSDSAEIPPLKKPHTQRTSSQSQMNQSSSSFSLFNRGDVTTAQYISQTLSLQSFHNQPYPFPPSPPSLYTPPPTSIPPPPTSTPPLPLSLTPPSPPTTSSLLHCR